MTKLAPPTVAVLLSLTGSAFASPPKSYVLHRSRHEHCRAHYVRKVERVKRHGKRVRVTVCVYVVPKPSAPPPPLAAPLSRPATLTSPTAPAPGLALHAHLDPSFTQSPSNPLAVTFSYSATASKSLGEPAPLPSGVLEFYSEGLLACSMNVGGAVGEGACPITYGSYGAHTVIVTYLSGEASATSGNETERIEPPNVTVQRTWTAGAASMVITKATAAVTLSAPSFEGASTVGLTDNLGDTCVAAVSGKQATCSMPVTGEPSGLTVSYPGGATTSHIEAVSPGGEHLVTEEWPPQIVPVTPSVIAYRASVKWSGWTIGTSGKSQDHGPGAPPEPTHVEAGERLVLDVATIGDYPGDEAALGSVAYTVEGPGAFTTVNTLYGLNPENPGSTDCSAVHNATGEAEAQCELTFAEAGTYNVRVSFTSEDGNYFSRSGPSATVVVG